jgi:protease I
MKLKGKRIAYLVGPGFEDLEFWVPFMRLQEEGAEVVAVGLKAGEVYRSKHDCLTATADLAADDVSADEFDAVVIPGGWAPDKIRRYDSIKKLVRDIYEQDKIIGLICHAGLVAISAGIVGGHQATGSLGIKDDIENAGGTWADAPAFRDGNLVWGRVVADIPDFNRELIEAIASR